MPDREKYFEDLFMRFSDPLFRYLYYRLGERERAKELTQEVFMRVWQQLAAGKNIQYEKAFLYRIARNLFINEIRTDKQTASLDVLTSVSGYEIADPDPSPEDISEQRAVLRLLETLSDPYREVLILRYIDGMAVKDIASLLGEKENNISMRIKRAIDALGISWNKKQ